MFFDTKKKKKKKIKDTSLLAKFIFCNHNLV